MGKGTERPASREELDKLMASAERLEDRLKFMADQQITHLREKYESILGDLNPDNITNKADELEKFLQRPGITESERETWLQTNTKGLIERGLISTVILRRQTQGQLQKVEEMFVSDVPDYLRGTLLQYRDGRQEDLRRIDQLTNYFYATASGITGQVQQLGVLDEIVRSTSGEVDSLIEG